MNESQRAAAERLIATKTRIVGQLWAAEVVALLRELLAEPQGEPVAWGVFVDDELFKPFNCKDEAVDWFQAQYNHGSRYDYLVLPLYAAPQQRRPLTREEIDDAIARHVDPVATYKRLHAFARDIEAKHDIKGVS